MPTAPRSQLQFRSLAAFLRTVRVIYLALAGGVLLFAAVCLGLGLADPAAGLDAPAAVLALTAVAAGFTAIVALGIALFGGRVYALMARRLGADGLGARLQAYLAAKILTAALCEGPALLWCVLALLTRQPIYLAGAALCLVLMLARLPSERDLESTVGLRSREIDRELRAASDG